jgi:WD40 repeat protein
MFDTLCTLPLPSDLFAQTLHPTLPLLTVGLSSGHVQTYKLPPAADSSDEASPPPPAYTNGTSQGVLLSRRRGSTASENGLGAIDKVWSTRRHKGSCRCLVYNHDGSIVYSAGTDGLIKAAYSETGRVTSKFAIPLDDRTGQVDEPSVLHALTPQTLLLATDSGRLYVHDLREDGRSMQSKASSVFRPHNEEFVSSLTPLPPSESSTSGFPKMWVTTGGSTLAVTDLRKGVIRTSEDQEEELTSSVYVGGLKKGGTSRGEKVLVGGAGGVVTLWEKGAWDDQDERIVLDRAGSAIECLVEVPEGHGGVGGGFGRKVVAAGLEDGRVRFIELGKNQILQELDIKHDDIDGVTALGFDVAGRMVSGGGEFVKIWDKAAGPPGGSRSVLGKHILEPIDSDEDSEVDSSNDEKEKGKRRKRKRNRGKDKSGGKAIQLSGFDL